MNNYFTTENKPRSAIQIRESALQTEKIQLDENVKKLLSQKSVLAWILQRNIGEFSGMELQDIMFCIEGVPEIGSRPVDPGETNTEITGMRNENTVPGEGTLFYDILFSVKIPHEHGYIKMIINVEAQKDFYPGYCIENRALFYSAREISSQKHTEFENSDYDSIKKVYSIWLCMDCPVRNANAISSYSISKHDLIPGIPDRREIYDKMTYVIVTLNQDIRSDDLFIEFMNVLFSWNMLPEDKKARLENEFGIHVGQEMKERMDAMCNYSEMVERKGIEKGIEKGMELGIYAGKILVYYEYGMKPIDIAKKMDIELEKVMQVLNQNGVLN